ncbi:transcriptional repressor LexA [Pikeienuella piscinae]|uniref:LexA repressor n=1 Tax=Pikeienuella piscinae TaxID=2748098 RepID=A0A7M3T6A0_9RHOB|nr:transcriptional repressor LexA [Pikeienuella piscinae]QIE57531.1 transcriptional repressor LexA [Pikeienuella piscinae]
MLTRKQLDLLKFIHGRISVDGVSPSFDEMKSALNLRSKSGIHRLITALEERGFIRRLAHRARAIEVIKLPEGMEQAGAAAPNVIRHDFRPRPEPAAVIDNAAGSVPLIGRIAAGTPIEALQHTVDHVTVPRAMLSPRAEHYALEVKGDSMLDAGIHEGDIVVVRRQDEAKDGDIVVALVEDQEATLKTLRRKGPVVELIAANPAYKTQSYDARSVKIQGRMVGLIRTY